ncbi:MAG: antitoxin Xre/MbcA/ParS toxin-binding domain-containing protein [Woeseiaceae bacterium]
MTVSAARTKASAKGRPRRKAGKAASKRKSTAALSIETVKDLSRALSHKTILDGVSAALVKSAVDHDVLALDEVHRFIPKSTFARKVRDHTSLSVEEGDRLARLARLKSYAGEVFQSREDADTWLNEKNPGLRGDAPIDLLLTDEGARRVELVLRRIDYGDYS